MLPFGRLERVIVGQPIVRAYAFDPVQPLESVAVTVKLKVPVCVGVPANTPAVVNDKPGGSAPPVTLNDVKVPLPPVAEIDWLYAAPITPAGNVGGERLIGVAVTITLPFTGLGGVKSLAPGSDALVFVIVIGVSTPQFAAERTLNDKDNTCRVPVWKTAGGDKAIPATKLPVGGEGGIGGLISKNAPATPEPSAGAADNCKYVGLKVTLNWIALTLAGASYSIETVTEPVPLGIV